MEPSLAAVLSVVAGLGLSACSGSSADAIDYAVDGTLITYNTNTVAGAASAARRRSPVCLTGFQLPRARRPDRR